ncbi:uncharacterized protein KY384_000754 [Bacidia gigantensis]|uniref:uncharacterized protein n=1 Tax=Bacidia gigantensis TaxID=2732470 RepID=UPI001D03CA4F|nr:uncharacterized protein KY384_000754 [Bacidia gigantensis]KAG8525992.1 hypothetical protein KY384_000754 [Bacidia gigantensis]
MTVKNHCGIVGQTMTESFLPFTPGQISTFIFDADELGYEQARLRGEITAEAQERTFRAARTDVGTNAQNANGDYLYHPLDVADLECPTTGYGRSTLPDGNITTTVGPPWLPLIVPPKELIYLNPEWRSACNNTIGQVLTDSFAIFDPPRALTPGQALGSSRSSENQAAAQTTAESPQSAPTIQPGQPVATVAAATGTPQSQRNNDPPQQGKSFADQFFDTKNGGNSVNGATDPALKEDPISKAGPGAKGVPAGKEEDKGTQDPQEPDQMAKQGNVGAVDPKQMSSIPQSSVSLANKSTEDTGSKKPDSDPQGMTPVDSPKDPTSNGEDGQVEGPQDPQKMVGYGDEGVAGSKDISSTPQLKASPPTQTTEYPGSNRPYSGQRVSTGSEANSVDSQDGPVGQVLENGIAMDSAISSLSPSVKPSSGSPEVGEADPKVDEAGLSGSDTSRGNKGVTPQASNISASVTASPPDSSVSAWSKLLDEIQVRPTGETLAQGSGRLFFNGTSALSITSRTATLNSTGISSSEGRVSSSTSLETSKASTSGSEAGGEGTDGNTETEGGLPLPPSVIPVTATVSSESAGAKRKIPRPYCIANVVTACCVVGRLWGFG